MKILSGLVEGQVLQRIGSAGADVQITGESAPLGKIVATLAGAKGALRGWKARSVGTSQSGSFSVHLRRIPAGGPYRLELQAGRDKTSCRAFYVGDLWILAGQSNMEGCGSMTNPSKPHPLVRAFSMGHSWSVARDPLHLLAESPDACHNGGIQLGPVAAEQAKRKAATGVGAGVFFAREMVRLSGVPQGLIATAHGGTSMTQWNPDTKDSMYASMLRSVRAVGQPVAGVLWYQGESDAGPADVPVYTERMKQLVAASRRDLRQPGLPWIIVQLSHFCSAADGSSWNAIQEQQRLLPKTIRKLETVSAVDLTLDDPIHIGSAAFPKLAARLARAADFLTHGKGQRPPQLKKISRPGHSALLIEVTYDSVVQELRAEGTPSGFALVNASGVPFPHIFKTTLHGDTVRLHCAGPTDGFALHYGHGYEPYCNITDGRGDALPVFGPFPFAAQNGIFPFVKTWKMSGIVTAEKPLNKIHCPDLNAYETTTTTSTATGGLEGFVDNHATWQGKSGQAYFGATLQLDEPMKLRFLMGYDGPFKLWVDGKPLFEDMDGANPCRPDQSKKSLALHAGSHSLVIGMDLNNGLAWGFFLRFVREGLSPAKLKAATGVPTYSI